MILFVLSVIGLSIALLLAFRAERRMQEAAREVDDVLFLISRDDDLDEEWDR